MLRSGHLLNIELDTGKKDYMPLRDVIPVMALCAVCDDPETNTFEVRMNMTKSE